MAGWDTLVSRVDELIPVAAPTPHRLEPRLEPA